MISSYINIIPPLLWLLRCLLNSNRLSPKQRRKERAELNYTVIARSEATWQSVLPYAIRKHTAVQKNGFPRPVTSVTGLATAAYHDSLICRLVHLGGMTGVFFTSPSLLPIGNSPKSGNPSVGRGPTAPLEGAPRGSVKYPPPRTIPTSLLHASPFRKT